MSRHKKLIEKNNKRIGYIMDSYKIEDRIRKNTRNTIDSRRRDIMYLILGFECYVSNFLEKYSNYVAEDRHRPLSRIESGDLYSMYNKDVYDINRIAYNINNEVWRFINFVKNSRLCIDEKVSNLEGFISQFNDLAKKNNEVNSYYKCLQSFIDGEIKNYHGTNRRGFYLTEVQESLSLLREMRGNGGCH